MSADAAPKMQGKRFLRRLKEECKKGRGNTKNNSTISGNFSNVYLPLTTQDAAFNSQRAHKATLYTVPILLIGHISRNGLYTPAKRVKSSDKNNRGYYYMSQGKSFKI